MKLEHYLAKRVILLFPGTCPHLQLKYRGPVAYASYLSVITY